MLASLRQPPCSPPNWSAVSELRRGDQKLIAVVFALSFLCAGQYFSSRAGPSRSMIATFATKSRLGISVQAQAKNPTRCIERMISIILWIHYNAVQTMRSGSLAECDEASLPKTFPRKNSCGTVYAACKLRLLHGHPTDSFSCFFKVTNDRVLQSESPSKSLFPLDNSVQSSSE